MSQNLRINSLRLRCPHCEGELVVAFNEIPVEKKRSGPKPGPKPTGKLVYMGPNAYDPGREVDDWILEQAETKSFTTLAKELEEKGIRTSRGKVKWDRAQARRLYHFALTRRAQRQVMN